MTKQSSNWKILPKAKKPGSKYPSWFYDVLAGRGVKTESEISDFLDPKYEDLYPSSAFLGTTSAAERVSRALLEQEKIAIYGDYDVDGTTSTALMIDVLSRVGAKDVVHHIPHRDNEGYGLNQAAINDLKDQGVSLIIAVDCGITSTEIIDSKDFVEVDFIVCDHHIIKKELLPKRAIIVHPELVGAGYKAQKLSACGMAFFLAKAIQEKVSGSFSAGQEKWLLDLVALSTICDIVPLVEQNRILAKYGLLVLSKTKRPGIIELCKVSSVPLEQIGSYHVGFILGPRINAAGRIEHANLALDLLLEKDTAKAARYARSLSELNSERQKLCTRIIAEAIAEIESSDKKEHEIFLLSDKNWPKGVVGIVASRINDTYTRPVIVFEEGDGEFHGSARSVDGFDITDALDKCGDLVSKFGGHAKAAGLTVNADRFIAFSDKIVEIVKGSIKTEQLKPTLTIDAAIDVKEITQDTLTLLSRMEPYGFGNREPVFVSKNVSITGSRMIGQKNEHLKYSVDGTSLTGIMFNSTEAVTDATHYDIVFNIKENNWKGRVNIDLNTKGIKKHV
jgi:single-stranded-DNA-specific exonuclease